MRRGSREYASWSIGIALVLAFALVPVLWILSLSLKTPWTYVRSAIRCARWPKQRLNCSSQRVLTL